VSHSYFCSHQANYISTILWSKSVFLSGCQYVRVCMCVSEIVNDPIFLYESLCVSVKVYKHTLIQCSLKSSGLAGLGSRATCFSCAVLGYFCL